jgi:hypothetical protein
LKSGEQVAARHGVGERTLRRDATFADAVDVMTDALDDEVRMQILTGDAPLSKQDVVTLAHVIDDEPDVGKPAAKLLLGEEPNNVRVETPHGVRDPETAILLARIQQECGEFTYYYQLFEQVKVDETPLVRHDPTQLKHILSLARKGEPVESTAEVVAMVGSRYGLINSIAQLKYLVHLAESGVSDEDAVEIVRRVDKQGESIYTVAWRYHFRAS